MPYGIATLVAPFVERKPDTATSRSVLFLLCFFLFWISISPFQTPTASAAGAQAESNILNQACLLIAAASAALFMVHNDWRLAARLISAPLVATLSVLTISTLASPDPANSFKHIVFTVLITVIAAGVLFVPTSQAHFRRLLTVGAVAVLAVCYLGVLLYPAAAIHHGGDALNELHDGAWRGLFRHKNQAGAAMALLVFIGLFIAREKRLFLGGAVAAGATIFLLQTGSKTPAALVLLVIFLTRIVRSLNRTGLRIAFMTAVVVFMGLLTVGTASIASLGDLARTVLPDPTFTNRTDVWHFAVNRVLEKPLLGHGFREFWETPGLVFSGYEMETWAHQATDGHNAYVDIALLAGIPALIVSLGWLLFQPIIDLKRAECFGNDNSLSLFYVHIWMYCIISSFFESLFFSGGGPIWFTFIMAVFGLRMNASATLVRS